jgi:hypothetical protein
MPTETAIDLEIYKKAEKLVIIQQALDIARKDLINESSQATAFFHSSYGGL